MSTQTISSTQQQEQVAIKNSAQARRYSADQKPAQAASVFSNLLQQANEPQSEKDAKASGRAEAAAKDKAKTKTKAADNGADPDSTATDPNNEWLALSQAYSGQRPQDAPDAINTETASGLTATDAPDGLTTALDGAKTNGDGNADDTTGAALLADDADSVAANPDETLTAEESAAQSPRQSTGKALIGAATLASASGASSAASTAASQAPGAAMLGSATAAVASSATAAATAASGAAAMLNTRLEPRPTVPSTEAFSADGDSEASSVLIDSSNPVTLPGSKPDAPQADAHASGDGGSTPSENLSSRDASTPEASATWAEQMGEAMEDVGHQVSYWLDKGIKQAQLKVDAGLGQPLDVAVSLDKGQAVLHFQTDNAAARTAIENNAAELLRQALARDGIGLAGLSVGSQDRQPNQSNGEASSGRQAWARAGGSESTEAITTATPRPAQSSNRVLDLYA